MSPIQWSCLALVLALAAPVVAQEATTPPAPTPPAPQAPAPQSTPQAPAPRPNQPGQANTQQPGPPNAPQPRRLPADSVTKHTVELPGRRLSFTATAGAVPINDPQGNLQGEIAFIAYTLDGADPAKRPVTFVLNGGPGSASAWLHLGLAGPWRLPIAAETASVSMRPEVIPNGDTWLDFTDLVFIDPVGTGFSRTSLMGDEARRRFWSVNGDIETISEAIEKWIGKSGRYISPKFILGESYAGYRGPRLARELAANHGVGVSGVVLISPALDFAWRSTWVQSPLRAAGILPTVIASAHERRGDKVTPELLKEAEAYAAGEFLVDAAKGPRDAAAVARIEARVAQLTGLEPSLVNRYLGRFDWAGLNREILRDEGLVASNYDLTVTAQDPFPNSTFTRIDDAFTDLLAAPVTAAILDLYAHRLNWKVEATYRLLNTSINNIWDWGRGISPPEAIVDLRRALALDRHLAVLVAHGYDDQVTPYFETKLQLAQIPEYGKVERLRLEVFAGGHMFYSREASRVAFRQIVESFFADQLK